MSKQVSRDLSTCRSHTIVTALGYIVEQQNNAVNLRNLRIDLGLNVSDMNMVRRELNHIDNKNGQIRYLAPHDTRSVVFVGDTPDSDVNCLLAAEAAVLNLNLEPVHKAKMKKLIMQFIKNEISTKEESNA
jgi:hypothetical protein